MKRVSESLNEFLNELKTHLEMYYVVNVEPDKYKVVDNKSNTLWEGNTYDAITFLIRNAGIDNTYLAREILAKADKFGGEEMNTGDAMYKKGPWGKKREMLKSSVKIPGALIMMSPFMVNKEIDKGKFETNRKTPEQVAKKQTREKEELEKELEKERNKKLGITATERRRWERTKRKEVIPKQEIVKKEILKKDDDSFPGIKQAFGDSKTRNQEVEKRILKKRRPRI